MISHATVLKWIFRILIFVVFVMCLVDGYYDLALVFYLTDSDNKLSLVDPFPNRRITYNQHYQNCDAKKGDIIIFPSDIVHFVRSNDKEEDRICISMNIKIL